MTVYNIFEGDLNGLSSFLGTYTQLEVGLGKVRGYFECVFFQIADSFATTEDIKELLSKNKTILIGTDNDYILYIFRSELNEVPCELATE